MVFDGVPKTWTVATIAEIADAQRYSCVGGPFGSNLTRKDYVPHSAFPVLRGNNFSVDSRFVDADFVFVSSDKADTLKSNSAFRGDLIFTQRGTIGGISLIPQSARFSTYILSQNLMKLRPSPAKADPLFCYYVFRSPAMQSFIQRNSIGSTIPGFNLTQLRETAIPLPPLAEQRRIAAVLGALDDKIELNRKMNRTLEQMAQAIFKSWFIDFDGHDPADLVESELGLIPRGWRIAHLGKLCSKIGSGATPRGGSDAYVDAGTSFIRSQNVYDFDFDWGGLVRLTDEDARQLQGVTVEKDDVLLNITGDSILRTCVVDPAVLPARVNQHVAIIRPKPPLASSILHLHLVHPRMKAWLLGHSAGATRKAVTKGHLEGIPVLLPPDEELHQVGASLAPMYAKRAANCAESRTLTTLRDTLLPKLISGEIRVPDAEATIAAAT